MNTACRSRRHGVMTMMALVMMGIVVVAMLGLGQALAGKVRQNQEAIVEAQMDQMMLAGIEMVKATSRTESVRVVVPGMGQEHGAAISIVPGANGVYEIVVGYDSRTQVQKVFRDVNGMVGPVN